METIKKKKAVNSRILEFTAFFNVPCGNRTHNWGLGVKRAVSTQIQPNPCGISKSNKINTFGPFIST